MRSPLLKSTKRPVTAHVSTAEQHTGPFLERREGRSAPPATVTDATSQTQKSAAMHPILQTGAAVAVLVAGLFLVDKTQDT